MVDNCYICSANKQQRIETIERVSADAKEHNSLRYTMPRGLESRVTYLLKYCKWKSLCQRVFEIQPAVITTFALYDLMALSEGLYFRSNIACRWANSQKP